MTPEDSEESALRDDDDVDSPGLTHESSPGGDHDVSESDSTPVADERPADEQPTWNRTDWNACGLILVACLLLVGLHVRSYETLSPIDELQHIDYVIRAGEFDIPLRNERVEFEAMSEAACRTVDAPNSVVPACGLDEYDPNDFQELGFNTAASQFPPYYVVTGVATRALTSIGMFDSKVTAARMLGAVWLAAALAVTWYIMACLDIRRRSRAAVTLLLLVTPFTIFHAGATINADISLMLCGAAVVLATIKFEAGRLRWWWLPLAYIGVLFVEATNVLAVAACGLYLLVRRVPDATLPPLARFGPIAILPALLIFRLEVAGRVQNALFPRARVEENSDALGSAPMFTNNRATGVSYDKVLAQLSSTFTPVRNPYLSPPLRSQVTIAGLQLTNWLLIALLFVAAFVVVTNLRAAWWSRITILLLLTAGPFYTFYFAYFSNQDFAAPARFALPVIPLIIVAAASAIERRETSWAVWTVAGVCGAHTLLQLVTA